MGESFTTTSYGLKGTGPNLAIICHVSFSNSFPGTLVPRRASFRHDDARRPARHQELQAAFQEHVGQIVLAIRIVGIA